MKTTESVEGTIEIVNDLIKINNDRIKGYEKALENTETLDAELRTLYSRMIEECYEYNRELSEIVVKHGGEPTSDTTISGKFIMHGWMLKRPLAVMTTNQF